MKKLRQALESGLLAGLFALCRWLGPDRASALGGAIARGIGPHLPVSRVGRANLAAALPELSDGDKERILREVWDNLGRTFAEYPHLAFLIERRLRVEGIENLTRWRDANPAIICFSGHFANWELLPIYAAQQGMPLTNIYRRPNNPGVERLLARARGEQAGRLIPKSAAGMRAVVAALVANQPLGLLVDQKLNDGVELPFFGRPAMTSVTLPQLAMRYGSPVIGAWIERTGGAHFRLVIEPELAMPKSGDRQADIRDGMIRINQRLEAWIRRRPGQWLWLHRRWKP